MSSNKAHFAATIPFAERFLPPWSHKRAQFEEWRAALLEYEEAHPQVRKRGPSPCRVPGCEKPVRGQGLCRSHYHRVTGH